MPVNFDISAIEVANYKAFRHSQRLELRQLTLLIGHNNAGKSALARIPVLLADSLKTRSSLLSLNARNLDFGTSFQDIVHGGFARGEVSFALDFQFRGKAFRLEIKVWGVQHQGDRPRPQMRDWSLFAREDYDEQVYPLTIKMEVSSEEQALTYRATAGGIELPPPPSFETLLPPLGWLLASLGKPSGGLEALETILALPELAGAIHHLGPIRVSPMRLYDLADLGPQDLGGRGEGAPQILAASRLSNDGLYEGVSQWFEEHFERRLVVNIQSSERGTGVFPITLESQSGTSVALADSGAGIAQILPLVVRRFQLEVKEWFPHLPALQVVEQPELHLHPAANAVVGDLLVDMALSGRIKVLAETHSENLILRIRRRIAEGKIRPDQVALYWTSSQDGEDSSTKLLEIEEDGTVPDWPTGVFSEDAEEARALARAMRARA